METFGRENYLEAGKDDKDYSHHNNQTRDKRQGRGRVNVKWNPTRWPITLWPKVHTKTKDRKENMKWALKLYWYVKKWKHNRQRHDTTRQVSRRSKRRASQWMETETGVLKKITAIKKTYSCKEICVWWHHKQVFTEYWWPEN